MRNTDVCFTEEQLEGEASPPLIVLPSGIYKISFQNISTSRV